MKKFISLLIGTALSMQMLSAVSLCTSAGISQLPAEIFTVNPSEITMTEGETYKLNITIDPEYADVASVYLWASNHKTLVSEDGTMTAYSCGEDSILIEVDVPDDSSASGNRVYRQTVKVQVQPDETLPAEIRAELDRLQESSPFGDYQRKTLELLGVLDAAAPRITAEQIDEILHSDLSLEKMLEKMIEEINRIHSYPDYIWRGDPGFCEYWLDEQGTDKIHIIGKTMYLRIKNYDDGTVKEVTALYPPELLSENIGTALVCSDGIYLQFNQFPCDYDHPVRGNANRDGIFNLADVFLLEKWLLAIPVSNMVNWEMADFNQDGKLNAIDLTLMKRELLYK